MQTFIPSKIGDYRVCIVYLYNLYNYTVILNTIFILTGIELIWLKTI